MGFTTFSDVAAKGTGSNPGFLKLFTAADVEYWLWVDVNGDLRIHTAEPSDPDADGTIVGTQS
jgi:hypothetical protein